MLVFKLKKKKLNNINHSSIFHLAIEKIELIQKLVFFVVFFYCTPGKTIQICFLLFYFFFFFFLHSSVLQNISIRSTLRFYDISFATHLTHIMQKQYSTDVTSATLLKCNLCGTVCIFPSLLGVFLSTSHIKK